MTHEPRKPGFPALAYPHTTSTSTSTSLITPLPVSLLFACNTARAQATICLLLPSPAATAQPPAPPPTFVLQYSAPLLLPSALGPATIPLPQHLLSTLARAGNPQIRTLSLHLKAPCPVWTAPGCTPQLRASRFVTGEEEHEGEKHMAMGRRGSLAAMAALARATRIAVMFDWNWLHRQQHAVFGRLVEQPAALGGFDVGGQRWRQGRYTVGDWRVFDVVDDDDAVGGEEGERPPDYDFTEASAKRRRAAAADGVAGKQGEKEEGEEGSARKRVLLSPYCERGSPTERDSDATPSPRAAVTVTPSPARSVCEEEKGVVKSREGLEPCTPPTASIPRFSSRSTPASPPNNLPTSTTPTALQTTLAALLPAALESLLPTLLTHPTSPLSSPSSQTSQPPPQTLTQLTPLATLLSSHIHARISRDLDLLYAHTISHANFLRASADDEFAVWLEEERVGLARVAEDGLEQFREDVESEGEKVLDRVREEAGRIEDGVVEGLEEGKREVEVLKGEKGLLRGEVEGLRRDKEELRRDKEDLRRDKAELRREIEELKEERDRLRRAVGTCPAEVGDAEAQRLDPGEKRARSMPG